MTREQLRRIALVVLTMATLTACASSTDSGQVVEIKRPSGGTVECAVISGGTRMAGIDCNWGDE